MKSGCKESSANTTKPVQMKLRTNVIKPDKLTSRSNIVKPKQTSLKASEANPAFENVLNGGGSSRCKESETNGIKSKHAVLCEKSKNPELAALSGNGSRPKHTMLKAGNPKPKQPRLCNKKVDSDLKKSKVKVKNSGYAELRTDVEKFSKTKSRGNINKSN